MASTDVKQAMLYLSDGIHYGESYKLVGQSVPDDYEDEARTIDGAAVRQSRA